MATSSFVVYCLILKFVFELTFIIGGSGCYRNLQLNHIVKKLNCISFKISMIDKFLPMKTMLGPRYDDQVAEENRFHPSMLSNFLKSLKVSQLMKIVAESNI